VYAALTPIAQKNFEGLEFAVAKLLQEKEERKIDRAIAKQ
jgi:hypothetical protein